MRLPSGLSAILIASTIAHAQSRGIRVTAQNEITASGGPPEIASIYERMNRRWTSATESLRGRTRSEVIAGTEPGARPGQYTLIDTADIVTVHPDTKTFTRLSLRAVLAQMSEMQSRLPVTSRNEHFETSMDSSAATDSATGTAVTRYVVRLKWETATSVDASIMPPSMPVPDIRTTTTTTYEYWYPVSGAQEPLPARPQMPPINDIAEKMREAMARLPHRRAIYTSTATHVENSHHTAPIDQKTTSRIMSQETTILDESRFVIPADYTERTSGTTPPADAAWLERWHKPPASEP